MSEDDRAPMARWAERFQDLAYDQEALARAGQTAERLGRRAGEACRDIPFEAEPSGFARSHGALARRARP